jgi:DNA-directed RNA polymerase I, II, and III subunit RPABC2
MLVKGKEVKSVKTSSKRRRRFKIGPPRLTRFERARIIGARALQLALGAPPLIPLRPDLKDPISMAKAELEAKALPISIRRTTPTGEFEDIPLVELL